MSRQGFVRRLNKLYWFQSGSCITIIENIAECFLNCKIFFPLNSDIHLQTRSLLPPEEEGARLDMEQFVHKQDCSETLQSPLNTWIRLCTVWKHFNLVSKHLQMISCSQITMITTDGRQKAIQCDLLCIFSLPSCCKYISERLYMTATIPHHLSPHKFWESKNTGPNFVYYQFLNTSINLPPSYKSNL